MNESKISNDLVEMSALTYFFVALSETTKSLSEDNENEFFLSFVEYIRQGNSIKNSIDLAKNDVKHEEG